MSFPAHLYQDMAKRTQWLPPNPCFSPQYSGQHISAETLMNMMLNAQVIANDVQARTQAAVVAQQKAIEDLSQKVEELKVQLQVPQPKTGDDRNQQYPIKRHRQERYLGPAVPMAPLSDDDDDEEECETLLFKLREPKKTSDK